MKNDIELNADHKNVFNPILNPNPTIPIINIFAIHNGENILTHDQLVNLSDSFIVKKMVNIVKAHNIGNPNKHIKPLENLDILYYLENTLMLCVFVLLLK